MDGGLVGKRDEFLCAYTGSDYRYDDVAPEPDPIADQDAAACADELTCSQVAIAATELRQLELVAQWCDLHQTPAVRHDRPLPGAERMVSIGGDGTPAVREFAAAELGILLGMSTPGAQGFMRDVMGLCHRHPRLYAAVRAGQARFFQARHVARLTQAASLDLEQARHVDERVAPFIGKVPWSRLMALVEAAIVEADPEAAEERRIAAEMARFVRTGRSSDYGVTTIIARARAGDAIFFLAMCDRIAQILRARRSLEVAGHRDRSTDGADAELEMDVLRSEAIGVLAHPVRALALLQWAEQHLGGADAEADPPPGGASPSPVSAPADADRWPAVVLDESVDPEAYRPRAVLHVHISEESFRRQTRGAARVEGAGPITLEQCADFLRHCRVTVRPVIDLGANPSADGYEVSSLVRRTMELRHPVETFPWGTLPSRQSDADHRRPYRAKSMLDPPGGAPPPAQTCVDNLQPLGRLHHRLKTHGGWQVTSPERGVHLWRSPHGHWVCVDSTGATYLGRLEGAPVVSQVLAAHMELLTG